MTNWPGLKPGRNMKRIGLVVFPGFQILDMAAASVFEMANLEVADPAYEIDVVSERPAAPSRARSAPRSRRSRLTRAPTTRCS